MKNNFSFPVEGGDSPWGEIQNIIPYSSDVVFIETASHGGFWVSAKSYKDMPKKYRDCSMTKNNYFEEDDAFCGVVLSFPSLFSAHNLISAEMAYNRYH